MHFHNYFCVLIDFEIARGTYILCTVAPKFLKCGRATERYFIFVWVPAKIDRWTRFQKPLICTMVNYCRYRIIIVIYYNHNHCAHVDNNIIIRLIRDMRYWFHCTRRTVYKNRGAIPFTGLKINTDNYLPIMPTIYLTF